jgi:hypothetical protein
MGRPMEYPKVKPESLALMQALLARAGVAKDAAEAFRQAYPDAPKEMINTAVFHVVSEGIEATVDWLAAIEQFLRDPSEGLDYGAVWHVIYHLYNWQQFQVLLPVGRVGLKEQLEDIGQFLEEGDSESAKQVLKRLSEALSGDARPPDIDEPL